MRAIAATLLLLASPALAQTAEISLQPPRFASAPWWMDQPIIASTGMVKTEIRANRASFSATFQAVAKTSPEATRQAAEKVRELGAVLARYGVEKVQVETTFQMRPIYEQYRDKSGSLIDNERADKIDSYEVNANVTVSVRDTALIEQVYATVLAARPTSTRPVYFSLDPSNETNTELYNLAVADAARRARLSVEATGAKLGPVKLIDPTGRACNTDVLVAGGPRDGNFGEGQLVTIRGNGPMAPSIVADDVGSFPDRNINEAISRIGGLALGRNADSSVTPDIQLPLQPPLRTLNAKACVVYSLGG